MGSGRLIKIAALLCIILMALFFIVPHMINLDKITQAITSEIEQKTGYQVSIQGAPYIESASKVRVIIPNISIKYNTANATQSFLQAETIVISLSWSNFVFRVMNFDSIEIVNSSIVINYLQNFEFISSIKKHFAIDSFNLTNANIFYNSDLNNPAYGNVKLETNFHYNNTADVKGSFTNNNFLFNVDMSYSHDSDSLEIDSVNANIYNSDINLNFYTKAGSLGSTGNLKIAVSNPLIIKDYVAKIFPCLDGAKHQSIQDNITISSDISYKDKNVELTNLKITSDKVNGGGNLSFSLLDNLNLKANLNFASVDLNKIFAIGNNQASVISSNQILEDDANTIENNNFINLDFIKNDINLQISAQEIKIENTNLENFNFILNSTNQTVSNSSVNFDITNNNNISKFSISDISLKTVDGVGIFLGNFINSGNNINNTLNLFGLKDSLSIEEENLNYSLNAQMILAPDEISLFNVNGKVGENEGSFSGSVATRITDITNYNIDLKFDHIALDNFNLPVFKARLQDLLVGSEQGDYLSKFIWFRTFTSAYTIKFGFTNTEFKNNKIDNLSVLCRLTPANMQLRGLIKSSFMDSAFSLDLKALSIKPSIDVKVYGNSLDYDLTTSIFSDILPQKSPDTLEVSNSTWSNSNLNVFRINKYNANFDLELKKLKFYNHDISNFQFTSHTTNDVLYIDNLGFDAYNGHIQTTGNISFFAQLLYQFSLSASSVESKNLFADFIPSINAFEGPISFTSSFVAEGSSPSELVSNLSISSNFASTGMTISGIDSDEVVDIALQRKATAKDQILSSITDSLNTGATNITGLTGSFKGTKGVIQCNDINFKSRFNSAMSAFTIDLNSLNLASNSQFVFMPYSGNNPITYNIIVSGNLKDTLHRQVDQTNLVAFVKATYNIVTAEDILAEQKAKKVQARKSLQQNQIQDPNDKNYLYYKWLMEENDN